MTPPITTASKKASKAPRSLIAFKTMTARPAAGLLTPNYDLLRSPPTIPPAILAIIPENQIASPSGNEAKAIPKQSGTATKNTIIEIIKDSLSRYLRIKLGKYLNSPHYFLYLTSIKTRLN